MLLLAALETDNMEASRERLEVCDEEGGGAGEGGPDKSDAKTCSSGSCDVCGGKRRKEEEEEGRRRRSKRKDE